MRTPEEIQKDNVWSETNPEGYSQCVSVEEIKEIQSEAYNQALVDASNALYVVPNCECHICFERQQAKQIIDRLKKK